MCSCEFCKISKSSFFIEHLQTTASVVHPGELVRTHIVQTSFCRGVYSFDQWKNGLIWTAWKWTNFSHANGNLKTVWITHTAWKVSKYVVISGPNTGKYGPEITPYLDTFHTVTDKKPDNLRLRLVI